MGNYWLNREEFTAVKDWGRMWRVEIEERPRHLWPDKWTIMGVWVDEKLAFENAEYKWNKEQQARCDRYWASGKIDLSILDMWDDHFSWHVSTPYWYLLENGTWKKNLIDGGIYNSYEKAIAVLFEFQNKSPRFENYKEYLEEHINEHNDPYGD